MTAARPFRFAALSISPSSGAEWAAFARKVEALGYSALAVGQHLALGGTGPLAALATAAGATTTLRLATQVVPLDFYPLATLAQEAATLDLLSDGRLELGIGAGWLRGDYEAAGVRFDPPGVRLGRLEEAVGPLKRLLRGEAVTHAGAHYQLQGLALPAPLARRPPPPLFLGGGGARGLALAAREADIVSLDLRGTAAGTKDLRTMAADAVAEKVGWVRQAAGARFTDLELHLPVLTTEVTGDREGAAERIAARLAGRPAAIVSNAAVRPADVLASPHALVGSVEQIVETLQARREAFGLSYLTVSGSVVEAFAPVVARLAGT